MNFSVILNPDDISPNPCSTNHIDTQEPPRNGAATVPDRSSTPPVNHPGEKSPSVAAVPWPRTSPISPQRKTKSSLTASPKYFLRPLYYVPHSCNVPLPVPTLKATQQEMRTSNAVRASPPPLLSPSPSIHRHSTLYRQVLSVTAPIPSLDIIVSQSSLSPSYIGTIMPNEPPVFRLEALPESRLSIGTLVSIVVAPQFGNIVDEPANSSNTVPLNNLTIDTHVYGRVARVTGGPGDSDGSRARAIVVNECPWSDIRFAEVDIPRSEAVVKRPRLARLDTGIISLQRRREEAQELQDMKLFALPRGEDRCIGHLCVQQVQPRK